MASSSSQTPAPLAMTSRDVAAREAQVLGDGPRISPMPMEALSEELLAVVAQMIRINSTLESRDSAHLARRALEDIPAADLAAEIAQLPEIVCTMLHHPQLFGLHTEVGIQLLTQGSLSHRDRELAILRVAWLCQAPFEWGEHVLVAKKFGLTSDDIEQITQGSASGVWNEHERAILKAAEELHDDAMITDATWATLSKTLDERRMIELLVLIGQYQAVAFYQNSLRLRLHEGNDGLRAR